MHIKIDLQEDVKLRNEIKNIIRGQVKKIIKEDLKTLIETEFNSRSKKDYYTKKVDNMFETGLSELIHKKIDSLILTDEFHKKFIIPETEKLVLRHLESFDLGELTEKISNEMLSKLVSNFKK